MDRDFDVVGGIYLVQAPHELDMHNHFSLTGLDYSIRDRTRVLTWRRGTGDWVPSALPVQVTVTFSEVKEFRFLPRDSEAPFSDDDCLMGFGFWTDEDWAEDGFFQVPDESKERIDSSWLTAVAFESGAVVAVQASAATAWIVSG